MFLMMIYVRGQLPMKLDLVTSGNMQSGPRVFHLSS